MQDGTEKREGEKITRGKGFKAEMQKAVKSKWLGISGGVAPSQPRELSRVFVIEAICQGRCAVDAIPALLRICISCFPWEGTALATLACFLLRTPLLFWEAKFSSSPSRQMTRCCKSLLVSVSLFSFFFFFAFYQLTQALFPNSLHNAYILMQPSLAPLSFLFFPLVFSPSHWRSSFFFSMRALATN